MGESELTPFGEACAERGWERPVVFLLAFHETAELIGLDITVCDRQQRRWRQPNPPQPRQRAWLVLQAMFGTDPAELGFPTHPAGGTIGSIRQRQGEVDVDRRGFVTGSLGAASGAMVTRPNGRVGSADVLHLREHLRALNALDYAYGGFDVRALAVRHLHRVRRIINTATFPETIGRQLHLLAGETAEMIAWLSFDMADQDAARRYWGEALTTATMLSDTGLEVMVLAEQSQQARREQRPREAYDLARAASNKAKSLESPVLLSLLAMKEALALSEMRDASAARSKLTRAMHLLDRADTGSPRPAPEWAAYYGRSELDFAQAALYTDAGSHRAAVPFLRASVTRTAANYGRSRAMYRVTLARSLAQAGEADEAAAETISAIEDLAEVKSARVFRVLVEVRGKLQSVDAICAREAVEAVTPYLNQHVSGNA